MDQVLSSFHVSPTVMVKSRPTIVIPNIKLTNPFTPPTTPPLTPVTPSTPTPTAEFPSGSVQSPKTPKARNACPVPFRSREIVQTMLPCEPKNEIGLLTPPLTPPSIQLINLPHCVCPVDGCNSRSFGICVGAPAMFVKDGLLPEASKDLTGSRKRKREEQERSDSKPTDYTERLQSPGHHIVPSHPLRIAPCNDCLDDDESLLWGRCDNKRCWSRRYDSCHQKSSSTRKGKGPTDNQTSEQQHTEIALICPDCSPEGGLGCEHRWICDSCAFSDVGADGSLALVWECPGCFTPLCSKCPTVSPSCSCPASSPSSSHSQSLQNPYCISCMPPASCVLCTELLPICLSAPAPACDPFSSSPGAESTYAFEGKASCTSSRSCGNCSASLCSGCRSVLKCSMTGCDAELCQLCPLPGDDGLGLDVGSIVCKECEIQLRRRRSVSW